MTAARRLAGAVALLVAIAGCAAIPTSGPVTEVAEDPGFGQSTVRYSPALPTDGAAPGDIVLGYLDAMLAYPSSTRTAAAFLTPAAADEWQRQAGVTIYDDVQVATAPEDGRTRADSGATAEVTLDAVQSGRLDPQGRFETGRGREGVEYRLTQVDGQWRIENPQPGLLVTDKFFDDYFRSFELYFFDRTAERLMPQPVHLLVEDGLAAAVITALARGDGSEQVQTFVPSLEDLRATVPVEDGVADVGFTAGSRRAADVERLSAQVVWSLRQVPGVTRVRISVGPTPVRPRDVAEQPITGWNEFGPSQGSEIAYVLADNQVMTVEGATVAAISGPWGEDANGAVAVAVADDRIALVRANRNSVQIAALDGAVQRTVNGAGFLEPVADVDGQFWLVDRQSADGTRVRLVGTGVRSISASALTGLDVRSIDISPGGARYVVTVGTGSDASVRVGRIIRDAKGAPTELAAPRRVDVGASGSQSAVWSDDVRVSFLSGTDGLIQMRTSLIDGSTVSDTSSGVGPRLPDANITGLAVGLGPDTVDYVSDEKGRLWYLGTGGTWVRVESEPISGIAYSP